MTKLAAASAPPLPEQSGSRRREILEIAAQLFARKGYRGTSMRDIGERAGVLGGSLYHHIKSKDALFVELHNAALDDGRKITPQLYDEILPQELARIEKEIGSARFQSGKFETATRLFSEMSKSAEFAEFLTLPAYELLD